MVTARLHYNNGEIETIDLDADQAVPVLEIYDEKNQTTNYFECRSPDIKGLRDLEYDQTTESGGGVYDESSSEYG